MPLTFWDAAVLLGSDEVTRHQIRTSAEQITNQLDQLRTFQQSQQNAQQLLNQRRELIYRTSREVRQWNTAKSENSAQVSYAARKLRKRLDSCRITSNSFTTLSEKEYFGQVNDAINTIIASESPKLRRMQDRVEAIERCYEEVVVATGLFKAAHFLAAQKAESAKDAMLPFGVYGICLLSFVVGYFLAFHDGMAFSFAATILIGGPIVFVLYRFVRFWVVQLLDTSPHIDEKAFLQSLVARYHIRAELISQPELALTWLKHSDSVLSPFSINIPASDEECAAAHAKLEQLMKETISSF